MALTRAVVDRFLKTNILTAPKKIESAERSCRIGRVEYECPDHAPGACQTEPIGLRPAGKLKGSVAPVRSERQARLSHLALPKMLRLFFVCGLFPADIKGHSQAVSNLS